MYWPETRAACAAALLLSTGLAWAADPEPALTGPPVREPAAVPMPPVMMPPMLAWPNMMPFPGGMPGQAWALPPGMMWPMPPNFPPAMMMPTAPQITWVPFVWVMVPQSLPPGMNGVSYGPVADTPVVKLDLPPSKPMAAGSVSSIDGGRQATAPAPMRFQAGESALPPLPLPVPDQVVGYGPVSSSPVVTLPAAGAPSRAASVIESKPPVLDAGATQTKQSLSDAPGVAIDHAVLAKIEPLAINQPVPEPAAPMVDAQVSPVFVDYGPVAPTPVVDLLALLPSVEPVVKAIAPVKKQRNRRIAAPVKKRTVKTAPPAKPRMCWTQGVVAPCR
ncbi:MAG TPA: hypothetical protein VIN38_15485 [Thiobacillus sp.]